MILVPLAHVKGGICGAEGSLGEAVAHLAVIFGLDADPETLLAGAGPLKASPVLEQKFQSAAKTIGEKMDGVIKWLDEPVDITNLDKSVRSRLLPDRGSDGCVGFRDGHRGGDGGAGAGCSPRARRARRASAPAHHRHRARRPAAAAEPPQ